MEEKIKKEIKEAVFTLQKKITNGGRNELLLTGGSAAFLYGSDRPFSNDMDFMISKNRINEIEKIINSSFEYHIKKPIFHSLKVVFSEKGKSYDLIAESVVQPSGHSESYIFFLTDELLKRKASVQLDGQMIYLISKELLTLIKLLAGRGRELGKYDLYDVWKIVTKNQDFDFTFFMSLVRQFCQPLEKSLPILIGHAETILNEHREKPIKQLLEGLTSLRPSA